MTTNYQLTSNPKVFLKDGKLWLIEKEVQCGPYVSVYGPHCVTLTFIPYPYEAV